MCEIIVAQIKQLMKCIFSKKEFRFLFVGGLNTIVGYGSCILINLFLPYMIAYTIATVIGIVHSFFWNKLFTFKSKGQVHHEVFRFVLVYLVSYVLGLGFLYLLVTKLIMNEYLAFAINLIFTTGISWFGHRYFSFKESVK